MEEAALEAVEERTQRTTSSAPCLDGLCEGVSTHQFQTASRSVSRLERKHKVKEYYQELLFPVRWVAIVCFLTFMITYNKKSP